MRREQISQRGKRFPMPPSHCGSKTRCTSGEGYVMEAAIKPQLRVCSNWSPDSPMAVSWRTTAITGVVLGCLIWTEWCSSYSLQTLMRISVCAIGVGVASGALTRTGRINASCLVTGMWIGQFIALAQLPNLGDAYQTFITSLAIINFSPLVAGFGVFIGHLLPAIFHPSKQAAGPRRQNPNGDRRRKPKVALIELTAK